MLCPRARERKSLIAPLLQTLLAVLSLSRVGAPWEFLPGRRLLIAFAMATTT